jgi:hypothetical protein
MFIIQAMGVFLAQESLPILVFLKNSFGLLTVASQESIRAARWLKRGGG